MTGQVRVFVSHHHSPAEDVFTARLVADLQTAGADVWVDTTGIASDDFVRRISEGLATRQWLVLVMTPDALKSPWVQREVNAALAEQTSGRMLGVLPLEMTACAVEEIPLLWRTLHRYDATHDYPAARDRLLQALGLMAASGGYTPPLPTQALPSSGVSTGRGHIQEFPLAIQKGGPIGIVAGPDGALWFTEGSGYRIGRITVDGQIQEYQIPGRGKFADALMPVGIVGITAGSDGALWFTNYDAKEIGRLTINGEVMRFTIPTWEASTPAGIHSGPDGALWFGTTNNIGHLTTEWAFNVYNLPGFIGGGAASITTGPDGAIWFTNPFKNYIGRIASDRKVQQFPVTDKKSKPSAIVTGPDGALWFLEPPVDRIGRMTLSGQLQEFPLPVSNSNLAGLTVGPDGALWFTESGANQIGRMTLDGRVQEFPLPSANSGPGSITVGPDGALWFTEYQGKRIGRITP